MKWRREPTLMRWPGHIPAGRSCDTTLATIDMLPTIANLAGENYPRARSMGWTSRR
ncbi:MAG: hypothetical protein QM755_17020 [Luteolibacter sp.]